ncbi:MAG TPA: DUF4097 family beta strand repeat-containing protein [Thermoanaerobaculia bacterium]|nr:DUF4097 family beta strand repeat-containing protein [Thermoanaerobaculia bacterium]
MTRRLLALALFLSAATAGATTLDQTYDRAFDVRPGARLVVENVNGRVTVTAWNEPRVRVIAYQHVESRDSDVARKTMAGLLTIIPDANGLRVRTNQPKNADGLFSWLAGMSVEARVTYDISVPRTMNLDIETVNGQLAAFNVTGVLRFSTTNGRINLERCAGELDASTTNGSVAVEMLSVVPGRPVKVSTTNGRISLTLPRTMAARIDASTSNGSVSSDIPVQTTAAGRHELRGTMNGGGNAELSLHTTNGSIEIKGR